MSDGDLRSPGDGRPSLRKIADASFPRFMLVGASNFLVSFATFNLMLLVLPGGIYEVAASQLISYAVGTVWSFFWNRRFTFGSDAHAGRQAVRFVALQAALAVSSSALISHCVHGLGLSPRPAWFAVMAVVTVVNYALCRWWVFR